MNNTSTFEPLLVAKGISLQALGLKEVGLLRGDALHAVELLRESRSRFWVATSTSSEGKVSNRHLRTGTLKRVPARDARNLPSVVVGKRRNTLRHFPTGGTCRRYLCSWCRRVSEV